MCPIIAPKLENAPRILGEYSTNFKLQIYLGALLRHWLEREPFLLPLKLQI